ncbi:MAG: DUF167 domain-containing protein [Planctomycetota bacterium]
MMVLGEHAEGLLLPVRAQPGARANAIRGLHRGAVKVAVTQVAEKGKANKALTQFLCKKLDLRRSQLTLCAGETTADKQFIVRGIGRDELVARIEAMLPGKA